MQTRRGIVYTLVVAALGGCALFTAPDPYRRLWMEDLTVPAAAVVGSVFEVRANVQFGACDENVHLAPRVEGDTVVVIARARNDGEVCIAIGLSDDRSLQLTAQPVPSMTIRFSMPDGSSIVRNVTVTPE